MKEYNARYKLKSDIEANWITNGTSLIPFAGEPIVYLPDKSQGGTYTYARLKIGDGEKNVNELPFIDAGTINGGTLPEDELAIYNNKNAFPQIGQADKLYVDLTTKVIYCYSNSAYVQLSNFTYSTDKVGVMALNSWNAGYPASFSCINGVLHITTGQSPLFNYDTVQVVRDITKEAIV